MAGFHDEKLPPFHRQATGIPSRELRTNAGNRQSEAGSHEIARRSGQHANAQKRKTQDQKDEAKFTFDVEQMFGYAANDRVALPLIGSDPGQLIDRLFVGHQAVNNPLEDCLYPPCQQDGTNASSECA